MENRENATRPRPPGRPLDAHLLCPKCGYDLHGIPEIRCPECGFGYDAKILRKTGTRAMWSLEAAAHETTRRAVAGTVLAIPTLCVMFGIGGPLSFMATFLAGLVGVFFWWADVEGGRGMGPLAIRLFPIFAGGLAFFAAALVTLRPGIGLVGSFMFVLSAWKTRVRDWPTWPVANAGDEAMKAAISHRARVAEAILVVSTITVFAAMFR